MFQANTVRVVCQRIRGALAGAPEPAGCGPAQAEVRPGGARQGQPVTIWMAPSGQAATQLPQPTHIRIDSSIGGSWRSSCSRSLWVHDRAAAQTRAGALLGSAAPTQSAAPARSSLRA